MKRALLLVLLAVVLARFAPQNGTDTKVTPTHTTSTGMVETSEKLIRYFALQAEAEPNGKEVSPTLPTPPSQTPEPTISSVEEEAAPVSIATIPTPLSVETASVNLTSPAGETPRQTVEEVWLTFYDCDVEGYCQVTKSGVTLEKGGRYAACDPDYWPFGTKMTVVGDPNGYVWTCVDTGSAVIGPDHWDVWFHNRVDGEEYLKSIGTTVTIQILP